MTRSASAPARRLALILAMSLSACWLDAAAAQADPRVLAKVDGTPITEDDVADALQDIGPGLPQKLEGPAREKYVLDYLIDLRLAAQRRRPTSSTRAPTFERRLAYYHDKLAMESLLTQVGKSATTEDAERKAYDEAAKAQPPEEEIHARHILLPTEDEAKAALARVKAGEDFAKVATELSKDPAGDGGDLGWFTKDRMVPEFADAAFKLKPGQVSDPVKTPVRLAHHQGRGKADEDLPALRAGQGAGRPLRRAEGAKRPDRLAARMRPRSSASTQARQAGPPTPRRRPRRPPPTDADKPEDPLTQTFAGARSCARAAPSLLDTPPWPLPPRSRRSRRRNIPPCPPIEGVRFATAAAGVRYPGRTDVMLALFDRPAAGRRRVHPLQVPLGAGRLVPRRSCRTARRARWSSIPATPTPSPARRAPSAVAAVAEAAAKAIGAAPSEVFMASTGVIGEPLDASADRRRVSARLAAARQARRADGRGRARS